LQGFIAQRQIVGQQLAALGGQIDQDCAGFPGPVAGRWAMRVDDGGNLVVRVEREEFRRQLVIAIEADQMGFVRQAQLFQCDGNLDAIGRRQRVQLYALGVAPAIFGDGEVSKLSCRVRRKLLSGIIHGFAECC
jgi:hypothetical protein